MALLPTWLKPWSASDDTVRTSNSAIERAAELHRSQASASTSMNAARAEQTGSTIPEDVDPESQAATSDETEGSYSGDVDFYRNGPSWAIPMTGASIGFVAGFYTAAKRSGLVFMAENAHRRPDTVQGWYFYNKTKNYKVLLGGARGGVRTALRVGLWTVAYVAVESGIRSVREGPLAQKADRGAQSGMNAAPWNGRWIDGAVAGLGVASGAGLLYRLPSPVARRLMLTGLLTGAGVGALRQVQSHLLHAREVQVLNTT